MPSLRALFAFAWLLAAVASPAQAGWHRVRVAVPDAAKLDRLLESRFTVLDCHPALGGVDVLLGPGQDPELRLAGFDFVYVAPADAPDAWARSQAGRTPPDVSPQSEEYRSRYFTADEINSFFEALRGQYPLVVTRHRIGTSVGGEAMWAYRFGRPLRLNGGPELCFIVIGLTHAREWVSGSCVMHVGRQAAVGLSSPQPAPFMANQAIWIVPILNPDGYRFSWTNDRYWRKNRRNNGNGTWGVDLNRNYSVGWGGAGSSGNGGSQIYRGTAPFSEPETQAVRDLARALPRVAAVADVHNYAQKVLWPWSYTTTPPANAAWYRQLGQSMVTAMACCGQSYEHGQGSVALYVAGGTSKDYFHEAFGASSLTIEMRDKGQYGFELPPAQIAPTQDEAWEAIRVLLASHPG